MLAPPRDLCIQAGPLHCMTLYEQANACEGLCCPGTGGWNQTDKIVRKAKVVPSTYASAAHAGSGRVTALHSSRPAPVK